MFKTKHFQVLNNELKVGSSDMSGEGRPSPSELQETTELKSGQLWLQETVEGIQCLPEENTRLTGQAEQDS